MDLSRRLDQHLARHFEHAPPGRWGSAPDGTPSRLGALAVDIRGLDAWSDDLVAWLLDGPVRSDPLALSVLVSALAPLAIRRCGRRPQLIDDLLTEIVIVAGSVDLNDLRRCRRRHASVILDRAWDEVRKRDRRPEPCVPVDPETLAGRPAGIGSDEPLLDRFALRELRAALIRDRAEHPAVVRAWNSVVHLSQRPRRTQPEKARFSYSVGVLRRHYQSDAAA